MTIEDEAELKALREIGKIVGRCLRLMGQHVRAGITTLELDQTGEGYLESHGATSAPRKCYDFPGATCISVNEEVAHGIPGDRILETGDVVHVDVSAEKGGFYADAGVTHVVGGASEEAERLCLATRKALQAAMKAARAGAQVRSIGQAVEEVAAKTGFTIIRNLGSHGIGRQLHEEPEFVPSFDNPQEQRVLAQGTVMTLEPFLTTGDAIASQSSDGWTLCNRMGSITAQYEHTIVVTRNRPLVLTAV